MSRALPCILILALLLILTGASSGAEIIDILAIGAVLPADSPIVSILEPDPGIRQTLVPTRHASAMDPETAKRYVRLYFPKSYAHLGEYEFIIYVAAPDVRPLTNRQIDFLKRSTSGGTPALADQGGISSDEVFRQAWVASGLHELFPNDASSVISHGVEHSLGTSSFRIEVRVDPTLPRVLRPFVDLGLEEILVSHGWYVVPKQGALIWAYMEGMFPAYQRDFPWLFSMQYDSGLTWNLGDNFVSSFWGSRYGECRNPYRTDVLMNIIYHSLGLELPDDILQVHRQREMFDEYLESKRHLLGVLEFVDSFGARTSDIQRRIEETDLIRDQARISYLEQRYQRSEDQLGEALEELENLEAEAVEAKNEALTWVYISEWTVTSATLIISGLVLHQLMIRRRLYSSTKTTSWKEN